MPVRRSTYRDLQAAYRRAIEERDDARKLAAERLSTVTRQADHIDQLRDEQPDVVVRPPRPTPGDAELRRQLELSQRARASLDEQCRTLQAANEAMAAELRDAAEGARA
jgi:hypothetical protein